MGSRLGPGLARFNKVDDSAARMLLGGCVDDRSWVATLLGRRPYANLDDLHRTASAALSALSDAALAAVLAGRPRLGGPIPPDNQHSPREQAVIRGAAGNVDDLEALLAEYERRFGVIFMIRAAGRTAADVVVEARRRLGNDPAAEWAEIRRELDEITQGRLDRVLTELADPRPLLLLVNPNTDTRTTALLDEVAREHLGDDPTVDLVSWQPTAGPALITTPAELAESALNVIREIDAVTATHDVAGVVVAAIGDPAVTALRETGQFPVVGIGEASVRAASRTGRRFAIVTTTPDLASSLAQLARAAAPTGNFSGVRLTRSPAEAGRDQASDDEFLARELAVAAREAAELDGAELVIIGGGPLARAARGMPVPAGVTIVEPLVAALDESLSLIAGPKQGPDLSLESVP